MVNIRAKLDMIRIRNLMYIKKNINRPQYRFSIYWMKFYFRDYLTNFNICPCGKEDDRPILYIDMIKKYKKFSNLFKIWCDSENPKRKTIFEKKNREKGKIFKPLDGKFLNNLTILKSRFIYSMCVKENIVMPKIPLDLTEIEQKNLYSKIHKLNKSSCIRIINYKLMFNGLPTNKKFKNRYGKMCFMCKKIVVEDIEHIFVNCNQTKLFYEFIRVKFLKNKNLKNSIDILQYKNKVSDEDFKILSTFIYTVWRIRNMSIYESGFDCQVVFKILYGKWLLSKSVT